MFENEIAAAHQKYPGVPAAIIRAVIQHESSGDPHAVADGGLAKGLMGMHPNAALTVGYDWNQLEDPAYAIMAGAAYLHFCYGLFEDWTWALAAYNQGPTIMGKAHRYADNALRTADHLEDVAGIMEKGDAV